MKKITHGNLFSGIGGMELAAEWCDWDNVFQVEIDKFCQKVLAKNFPKTKRYGDIKEFDGTKYRGTIDVLSASPPCQPTSVAGKRKGKSDDRWLWPEALRVCREIKPSFIIFENPPGILTLENGKPFNEILLALESQGYKIEIFNIPAASKKAWHRRERIWILAYSGCWDTRQSGNAKEVSSERHGTENSSGKACRSGSNDRKRVVTNSDSNGNEGKLDTGTDKETPTGSKSKDQQQARRCKNGKWIRVEFKSSSEIVANANNTGKRTSKSKVDTNEQANKQDRSEPQSEFSGYSKDASDTEKIRLQRGIKTNKIKRQKYNDKQFNGCNRKWNESREQWKIESYVGGVASRLPLELDGYWDREPENVPRVATGVKNRANRIKGLGNAVVPQIPYIFFSIISQILNDK